MSDYLNSQNTRLMDPATPGLLDGDTVTLANGAKFVLVSGSWEPLGLGSASKQQLVTASSSGLEPAFGDEPTVRNAIRRLAIGQRRITDDVMATPPTVTEGVANANSTVWTNQDVYTLTCKPDDPRVVQVSGSGWNISGTNYYALYINETLAGATPGWGISFFTDAGAFEFCARADIAFRYRCRIDGQWVQAADHVHAAGTGFFFVKFDFGAGNGTPRLVELFFTAATAIRGITFGASAGTTMANNPHKAWAPVFDHPRVMVFADSYGAGVGATNIREGFAYALGAELGCPNPIASGAGGQGFIATSNTGNLTAIARVTDISRCGPLDLLVVALGINDAGRPAANVQAAVTAFLTAALAQTQARIIVLGPWTGPSKVTPAAIFTAIRDGVAAVGSPRIQYIDTTGWLDTSGGNSTIYNSGDGVHKNSAGHKYLGRRAGRAILSMLQQ